MHGWNPSSCRVTLSSKHTHNQTKVPIQHDTLELCNVDHVSSNAKSSQCGAMLYISEENEAVIKTIIKGRSPTMRHVSRTHRVALDWSFRRINLDPKIQIKYVDTKHQFADMLTKKNFTISFRNYREDFVSTRNSSLQETQNRRQ